jgi:hypothetical protein
MEEKEGFLIYAIDIEGVKFIEWLAIFWSLEPFISSVQLKMGVNWFHGVF